MKRSGLIASCTVLLVTVLSGSIHAADTQTFESPAHRVRLLELFTSEGCSSCPPADRWISSQTDNPDLWNDIVPLAFHVDYWDYLGWQDRFARPAYSQRQRTWARERAVRTVYTPGFVVDGQEWRAWFSSRQLPGRADRRAGKLNVSVSNEIVEVLFEPLVSSHQYTAHIALLGFGLETDVRAGENRGRKLTHDFVVLGINTSSLEASKSEFGATLKLPSSEEEPGRHAIAAWVTGPDSQRPLQAVGGWLESTGSN